MLTNVLRGNIIADLYAPLLRPDSSVLDVGCGNGVVSSLVSRRLSLRLTGTDVDDYGKKPFPFARTDGRRLPFGDAGFDATMFNDALHHAVDQRTLLDEARRVSRMTVIFEAEPGGVFALFDRWINFFHHKGMPVPLTFRSSDEWRRVLGEWGFSAKVTALGRPRWWYPFKHILIVIEHESASH